MFIIIYVRTFNFQIEFYYKVLNASKQELLYAKGLNLQAGAISEYDIFDHTLYPGE